MVQSAPAEGGAFSQMTEDIAWEEQISLAPEFKLVVSR